MADNEDDSGSTRTITTADLPAAPAQPAATNCTHSGGSSPAASAVDLTQPGTNVSAAGQSSPPGAEGAQPAESSPAESGAQLAQFLQSCPAEQSIVLGTEFTGLGPDLVNTTIIYVQADGTLVEGSGLTAEEQQALLEQLTKQQVVQVSDTEAAQLLQQSQLVKTVPVHNTALDPSQLQQVINQVAKSQQQVHLVPQQTPQVQKQQNLKSTTQNNASQQLKSAAQQVVLQSSGSVQVVQKKVGQPKVCFSGSLWSRLVGTVCLVWSVPGSV